MIGLIARSGWFRLWLSLIEGHDKFRTAVPQMKMKPKGLTLIELLIALFFLAMVVAGIYRLFLTQNTAYSVQDQVVEVQQNIRGAMEILLRDLRMTGYDDDCLASQATHVDVLVPIATPLSENSITVSYEYNDESHTSHELHTIRYRTEARSLLRQLTVGGVAQGEETLLENVDRLTFEYGVDTDEDGDVDNWVSATGVGISKVIAVRVTLRASPASANTDVQERVVPRTLTSRVTFRNRTM